ncbi:MAG: SRPBCC family protein [Panacagrimonas sp.]
MNEAADVSLSLVRELNASLEQAFSAWTNPQLMEKWFAPGEKQAQVSLDLRVGGRYRVQMRDPDGTTHVVGGEYRQIEPNRRIVKTWQWEGSEEVSEVTVAFRQMSPEQTEVTLTHARFPESETKDRHVQGWSGCLVKLVALYQ